MNKDELDIRVGDIVMYNGPKATKHYRVVRITNDTARITYINKHDAGLFIARIRNLKLVERPNKTDGYNYAIRDTLNTIQIITNKKGESKMNKLIEKYLEESRNELVTIRETALNKIYEGNVFNKLKAKHIKEFNDKVIEVFGPESNNIVEAYNLNKDNLLSKKEINDVETIMKEYRTKYVALTNKCDKVQTLLDMTDNFEQAERILKEYGIL